HRSHLPVDVLRDHAWTAKRDAVVQRAPYGVEAPARLEIGLADEDRVGRVGPAAVDPGRGIGEDEITWLDNPLRRDAPTGRGRLRAGRHREDRRHPPARLAEHRR